MATRKNKAETTGSAKKTATDQQKKRRPTPASWKAGQSGNPNGRPRKGESLSEVVRAEVSPLAITKRMQRLADHAESETVRYHALNWLAERGHGKTIERRELAVAHTFADDAPRPLQEMSDEELERELAEAEEAKAQQQSNVGAIH